MKEQPLFAPGDRVVCVDANAYGTQKGKGDDIELIEGKTYTVLKVRRESCCGRISVDVGLVIDPQVSSTWCACGARQSPNVYKMQTRFVPVDFDRYADEVLHESLKGKPIVKYELN